MTFRAEETVFGETFSGNASVFVRQRRRRHRQRRLCPLAGRFVGIVSAAFAPIAGRVGIVSAAFAPIAGRFVGVESVSSADGGSPAAVIGHCRSPPRRRSLRRLHATRRIANPAVVSVRRSPEDIEWTATGSLSSCRRKKYRNQPNGNVTTLMVT